MCSGSRCDVRAHALRVGPAAVAARRPQRHAARPARPAARRRRRHRRPHHACGRRHRPRRARAGAAGRVDRRRGGRDMSLLLYAIAEADAGAAAAAVRGGGLDGRPLAAVLGGGLAAVVSEHDEPPRERSPARLREYGRAVDALMAALPALLPARFGTVLAGPAAARAALARNAGEWSAALARVRGAVELAVRAEWPDAAPAPAPSCGRDYLRAQ